MHAHDGLCGRTKDALGRKISRALLMGGVLTLVLPGVALAADPTLTGETITAQGEVEPGALQIDCPTAGGAGTAQVSFLIFVTAVGPYPSLAGGSVLEHIDLSFDGAGNFTLVGEDFRIENGTTVVTGHKSGGTGPNGPGSCTPTSFTAGPSLGTASVPPYVPVTYTATLPDGSADSGISTFGADPTGSTPFTGANFVLTGNTEALFSSLSESFVSTSHPMSKEQCKDGGYVNYVDDQNQPFRNQGQCVKYVNEHGAS